MTENYEVITALDGESACEKFFSGIVHIQCGKQRFIVAGQLLSPVLCIMVSFLVPNKKRNRYEQCHRLRHSDRQPDSVDPEKEWQQADSGNLKYQRA